MGTRTVSIGLESERKMWMLMTCRSMLSQVRQSGQESELTGCDRKKTPITSTNEMRLLSIYGYQSVSRSATRMNVYHNVNRRVNSSLQLIPQHHPISQKPFESSKPVRRSTRSSDKNSWRPLQYMKSTNHCNYQSARSKPTPPAPKYHRWRHPIGSTSILCLCA
jgi:hypothetical protein